MLVSKFTTPASCKTSTWGKKPSFFVPLPTNFFFGGPLRSFFFFFFLFMYINLLKQPPRVKLPY